MRVLLVTAPACASPASAGDERRLPHGRRGPHPVLRDHGAHEANGDHDRGDIDQGQAGSDRHPNIPAARADPAFGCRST